MRKLARITFHRDGKVSAFKTVIGNYHRRPDNKWQFFASGMSSYTLIKRTLREMTRELSERYALNN